MRATFTATGYATLELAGTGRESSSELTVAIADQIQEVAPLRAAEGNVQHRGGRLYALGWSVTREHASASEAERYLLDHAAELPPAVGVLTVTTGGGSGPTSTRTFRRATVQLASGRVIGRTSFVTYAARGRVAA